MDFTPKYFNRDISWLSFNYRVLQEANDENLPVYERLKFCAIFSNNLDEFYKVRVASYRSLFEGDDQFQSKLHSNIYEIPRHIVHEINTIVRKQLLELGNIYRTKIIPELAKKSIILYNRQEYADIHKEFVNNYFKEHIYPILEPVLFEKDSSLPYLEDNAIYLAVQLFKKNKKKIKYGLLRIPNHQLPRFVQLPKLEGKFYVTYLDDIIKTNLQAIFPMHEIGDSYSFKLSRDAELNIGDEFTGNLIEKIREGLHHRKTGAPARFLYDLETPDEFLKVFTKAFNLSVHDLMPGSRHHHFADFFGFPNPFSPKYEVQPIQHLPHPGIEKHYSIFNAIRMRDWILHFPYHTYDYVIQFLNYAAINPKVEEIMTTQYRVATNSAIVGALISAARNGKKVTVFVEMKARFDEEANLHFYEKMQSAGIKVISSIPGLKVHAKAALAIKRPNKEGRRRGYAFLSTGNFNEKTARLYADHGLFTAHEGIVADVREMFRYLEDQSYTPKFKHILVAQFNLRQTIKNYINREIANAQQGKEAYLLLKMNGLEDRKVINILYEASMAGVKVDLLVRGICCLVPNQEFSKNIRLVRIVDSFLEHARVFIFYNSGNYDTYIASADLMKRNLYRRIETGIPIYNEGIKKELLDIYQIQMSDNVKARLIDENLNNNRIIDANANRKIRSQKAIYTYVENSMKQFEDYNPNGD